VKQLTQ